MYEYSRGARDYYSSSSDTTDSDYSCSDDDDDDGVTIVTVNGKRVTADETASRLGNIQIGSGRCLVVGEASRQHHRTHRQHHEKRKREKSKTKHEYHIDPKLIASKADFDTVASEIGKHWKKLARELGLSRGIIEAVAIDFSAEGSYEQAYQALRKWNQKHANSARLVNLVDALKEIGYGEICMKLGK